MSWRRELAIATLCGLVFALPGLLVQWGAAAAVAPARELATLLTFGAASSAHLVLGPLDAALSSAARVVILALLCRVVAWPLVGWLPWRDGIAVLARASRVLAWAPALALLIAAGAWIRHRGLLPNQDVVPLIALAYPAGKVWLAAQATLWLWVCVRHAVGLRRELALPLLEAWWVGTAPMWAVVVAALLDAAL